MIDVATDELLTMAEAGRILPGRPSVSTLWRWSRGMRGVRLSTVLIGAKRYTTRQAIQDFSRKLTELDQQRSSSSTAVAAPSPKRDSRTTEEALDRELR